MSDDGLEHRTLKTMAGSCEVCHRDFSMWEIGVFREDDEDDDEPIEVYYECSHCGHRGE